MDTISPLCVHFIYIAQRTQKLKVLYSHSDFEEEVEKRMKMQIQKRNKEEIMN